MSLYSHAIVGFVRSNKTANNETVIIYLKQEYLEENSPVQFVVKVMIGTVKTEVKRDYSLSSAMREFAEQIAQFTDGFSTWKSIDR